MRTLNALTLLTALVLGITTQAGAVLFNITFDDGNGNVGSGQIDVELANGIYYAASGSLTVTAGQASGTWSLSTAGGYTSYPNYFTSPDGAFIYNNAVYPTGYNPQYPISNPLLDEYGLLFTQDNGNELNLWGNADGTYNLGGYIGGSLILDVTISFGGTTITPNPAPASKLVFTTTAVSVTAGTASGTITVQRQDPSGNPNTTDANRSVTLSSDSSGTATFSPASPLTIAYGSSSASFTYTDTKAGNPTITAASTSPTTITSATQQETVNKATPSISGITASQGITYGTATVTLSGTVSAPGSVYPANGETVSVTINGSSQNATISGGAGGFSINFPTATIPYAAGAYTITYAYAGDGNLNAAANNTSTVLTVNKAALSITANAQSKTYGQTVTFGSGSTLFTSSGLQNGETIGSVTLVCSGGAGTAAVSGSPYTITPSAATGGTFNSANYTITYNTGNLTVNKATLTITADSDTKMYGDTKTYGVGSTAFTSTGLQNGETIGSVTITASGGTGATDPVGSYTLTPSAATGGNFSAANYNIGYDNGTLTVMTMASGTITLPGYLGPTEVVVDFVAKNGSTVLGQAQMTLPASGAPNVSYAIGVPAGTTSLNVKPRFYLRKNTDVAGSITGNEVTLNLGPFTGGDVDGNNQVDGTDYAWLRYWWGYTLEAWTGAVAGTGLTYDINGDGKIDANDFPDLNGDGVIDSKDYDILKDGWYQAGDPE